VLQALRAAFDADDEGTPQFLAEAKAGSEPGKLPPRGWRGGREKLIKEIYADAARTVVENWAQQAVKKGARRLNEARPAENP